MKPDIYTKVVLTVIAVMLTVIACNQYASPAATVQAQGPFAGIQFSAIAGGDKFFDTRTGEVWSYAYNAGEQIITKSKIIKLGQKLDRRDMSQ